MKAKRLANTLKLRLTNSTPRLGVTMKRQIILTVFALFAVTGGFRLAAQVTVSGLLDSSVSLRAGAADSPPFSYGFEEYANLRFQSRIKDRAVIYGAVNLLAAAGDYAANAALMSMTSNSSPISASAFIAGENFIAAIELERLYFKLKFETVDLDGGLFRLPFGYGQVWGSSDFLNPKNPLKPDARPCAILGAALSWYPTEETKLLTFYSAPRQPFSVEGEGSFLGISFDKHWNNASVQTLYSFETPSTGSNKGIHRAGLSVKADIKAGLVIDTLYSYNSEDETGIDGLSFSFGADYSFFDGRMIVLAEYLYNGDASSTSRNFSNNNYLYTGLTWRFNDYTNINAAVITGFDDISFTPVITLNHDLFQGAALTVTAQTPMDRDLFSGNGRHGELGPIPPDKLQPLWNETTETGSRVGRYFDISAKLRLRF